MARSRNPVESVVALLTVLGIKAVEVTTTETPITSGLRASRPANVSTRLTQCLLSRLYLCLLTNAYMYTHEQSRRRQSVWYATNAAPSRNLGKSVVVVAVVLGSDTAEVPITPIFIARGTRASRPAKHGRSSRRQPSADRQTRFNS